MKNMLLSRKNIYYLTILTTIIGTLLSEYIVNYWVISETGTTSTLSYILTFATIPLVIITLLSGIITDLYNKKILIVTVDLISAVICFIAFILLTNGFNLYVLAVMTIILRLTNNFYSIVSKGIITDLFDREDVYSINSTATIIKQLSRIVIPFVGNIFLLIFTPQLVVLFNGFSFFFSAMLESTWKLEKHDKAYAQKSVNYLTTIKYLRSQKPILNDVLYASVANFWFAGYTVLSTYMFLIYFNSTFLYTLSLMFGALGAICGAFFVRLVSFKNNKVSIFLILIILAILFTFSIPNYIYYIVLSFVFDFGVTLFNIKFFSDLQINVEQIRIGQVIALVFAIVSILTPLGTLLVSNFDKLFNAYSYNIIGLGLLITLILVYLIFRNGEK